MEMQLAGRRQGGGGSRQGDRGGGLIAMAALMIDRLRKLGRQALVRIKTVQAHGSKGKQLKLIESLALGNRRQLLLIVCDNQKYLVGAGADSVGSILAMDTGAASRDRAARGPELVRRRGREVGHETRLKAGESGPDLWH